MKKSDYGVIGFIVASFSFLLIFTYGGIIPIIATIAGVVVFVCCIDKDIVPKRKH